MNLIIGGLHGRGTVGYGRIGRNELGFDDVLSRIITRSDLSGYETLSAHAPSVFDIESDVPVRIFGFLNASAGSGRMGSPVEFWMDDTYLGKVDDPCEETRAAVFGAGRHTLTVRCHGNNTCRHSVWAVAEATPAEVPTLAVCTVAAYPDKEVLRWIGPLAESAAKQGLCLNVFGRGMAYNHFDTKVLEFVAGIDRLPSHYKHVLYIDGSDGVLAASAQEILQKFREFNSPIVAGAELNCWPERGDAWAKLFPAQSNGLRFLNAGLIMGERTAMVQAYKTLMSVSHQLARGDDPTGIEQAWPYRGWHRDDQFLWQVCYLHNKFPMTLDTDFKLLANILGLELDLHQNPAWTGEDRPRRKVGGNAPCVLHFPGTGATCRVHAWANKYDLT